MKVAGVVLCGGQSRRMGRDKSWIEIAGEPLLVRTVRTLQAATTPVIVAAGVDQRLPELPSDVEIVRDSAAFHGPLSALAQVFVKLSNPPYAADAAFVAACDLPLLTPAVVAFVCGRLHMLDAAIPRIDGRLQPLAGVYRTNLHSTIRELLTNGKTRMRDLTEACDSAIVDGAEFAAAGIDLRAFANANTWGDLEALIGDG